MSLSQTFTKIAAKEAKAGSYMIVELDAKKKVQIRGESGVGLASLKSNLPTDKVCWAAINVHGVDVRANVESVRTKVVQINWVGKDVPAMKRMQALAGKEKVGKIFKGVALTMDVTIAEDVTPELIVKALLACGGAHKPTYYQMGAEEGEKVEANFYDPANK
ncbi:hypothetical protein AAMO2058_000170000 [Amorphochlora amoebiformis]